MRRREFISIIGAAISWPIAAHAQQGERVRRIGVLMNRAADDPDGQARLAVFTQALKQLGWSDGGNVRIDTRWGEDNVDRQGRGAAELMALAPDIILASGSLSVAPLQRINRTVPIVFVAVTDPVGGGIVENLARPGGNATGFLTFEYSLGGKWVDLLKQVAPNVTRVAVLRDTDIPSGIAMFGVIQSAAQLRGMEVNPVLMRDASEIERALAAFTRAGNGGLIVTPGAAVSVHRDLIVGLAARHRLPAVYPYRYMPAAGGLMSYAPDQVDDFTRAAGYVDRILKGEKPGDLPVQAPTKFELVINTKTAKALGLAIPEALVAAADQVIE